MFLRILDTLRNEEFVVLHNIPLHEFENKCNVLYKSLFSNPEKNTTIEFVGEKTCNVYENVSDLQKGWVYNSKITKKNLLYNILLVDEHIDACVVLDNHTNDSDCSESDIEVGSGECVKQNMFYGSGYAPNIVSHGVTPLVSHDVTPIVRNELLKELLEKLSKPRLGLTPSQDFIGPRLENGSTGVKFWKND
jgi:hypothetical protein